MMFLPTKLKTLTPSFSTPERSWRFWWNQQCDALHEYASPPRHQSRKLQYQKKEAWRRLVLECDPRARTRAAGLTQRLLAFEFPSDTASFELFDKECLWLKQVTGIDIQDEVKCRLLTLHLHDEMLRHHLILHASKLDTFSKVTAAAGGVAPMHVGAVKGKDKKDHGRQGQRYKRAHASGEGETTPGSCQRRTRTNMASTVKRKVTPRTLAETASAT